VIDETEVAGRTAEPKAAEEASRRYLVPGLIVGLVLALSLAVTFGALYLLGLRATPAEVDDYMSGQSPAADRTASEVTTLLLNYDATNIDKVAERMIALSTGNFREDYERLVAGGLGSALKKVSASSRGQIIEGPDVAFRSPSEALALLRVTQTTQSNENPGGRTIEYVLKITLVDTSDGGWKADRVEVLSES